MLCEINRGNLYLQNMNFGTTANCDFRLTRD
jgi:hypothetical protein